MLTDAQARALFDRLMADPRARSPLVAAMEAIEAATWPLPLMPAVRQVTIAPEVAGRIRPLPAGSDIAATPRRYAE